MKKILQSGFENANPHNIKRLTAVYFSYNSFQFCKKYYLIIAARWVGKTFLP